VFTDVWFGIRTSNGRKWRKSIPLADNKHCYIVVVVYIWVSEKRQCHSDGVLVV